MKTTYSNKYWPDNGEIDLMEQVGYEPTRIHSSVHTQANNHMSNNHPTNSVNVPDATRKFKVYTLQWNADKMEMFVGDDRNALKTRILVWNKQGDWKTWSNHHHHSIDQIIISVFCFSLGLLISHSLF